MKIAKPVNGTPLDGNLPQRRFVALKGEEPAGEGLGAQLQAGKLQGKGHDLGYALWQVESRNGQPTFHLVLSDSQRGGEFIASVKWNRDENKPVAWLEDLDVNPVRRNQGNEALVLRALKYLEPGIASIQGFAGDREVGKVVHHQNWQALPAFWDGSAGSEIDSRFNTRWSQMGLEPLEKDFVIDVSPTVTSKPKDHASLGFDL